MPTLPDPVFLSNPRKDGLAPVAKLDPRRNAFRQDLASSSLKGLVKAERFVDGSLWQVRWPAAPLRKGPDAKLSLETEALHGELVRVYEEYDGWAYAQLHADRYVGYIPLAALSPNVTPTNHRVSSLGTYVYPEPSIKSPPVKLLSMMAEVTVVEADAALSRLEGGGYVATRHLSPCTKPERDFVEIAERFQGTPYLWGGKTRLGIDCSGLVQLALSSSLIEAPRDSDMQQAETGVALPEPFDVTTLERGDLVTFEGHCGMMLDSILMVHANAYHMAVTIEPLDVVVQRATKTGHPISAIKRIGAHHKAI